MITFFVPGKPVPKKAPRVVRRGDKIVAISNGLQERFENLVALACRNAMGEQKPLEGPVRLDIEVILPIPASWSTKKRARAAAGALKPCVKPDYTNIMKAVEDGCNGIAFIDDKQCTDGCWAKRYGEKPGVKVYISDATSFFWTDYLGCTTQSKSNTESAPNADRSHPSGPPRG